MTAYITNDTDLGAVADAIRAKTGGSLPILFPGGFVSEIASIPSGGHDPMEDLYILDGKCRMVVEVSDYEKDNFYFRGNANYNKDLEIAWGDGTTSQTDANFDGFFRHTYTKAGRYCITITVKSGSFYPKFERNEMHSYHDGYISLLGVELSQGAEFANLGFTYQSMLTDVVIYFPSGMAKSQKVIPQFNNTYSLKRLKIVDDGTETFEMPSSLFASSSGQNYFLEEIVLPDTVTALKVSSFTKSNSLKTVDLGSGILNISNESFKECYLLDKLIIRNPNFTVTLGTTVFDSTKIASGTGYIYVPDARVTAYKSATNWSAYASQIKGLSELEGN